MKINQIISVVFFLLASAGALIGQEKEELSKVEIFGGYSLLRSSGENFHGWKAAVDLNVNRWLAIAVDADGHYFSESTAAGKLKESEYSVTFGPHFSYRKNKIVPFAYAMAGPAWEKSSHGVARSSQIGFAFEVGGGLDWEASKLVTVRLIDIGASTTRFDGHTETKPKISTGLVFKFGRK